MVKPYDRPQRLERLRNRSLGRKRGLALRECVFAVLALESEPVDPRL